MSNIYPFIKLNTSAIQFVNANHIVMIEQKEGKTIFTLNAIGSDGKSLKVESRGSFAVSEIAKATRIKD